jgi:hypothetical protein
VILELCVCLPLALNAGSEPQPVPTPGPAAQAAPLYTNRDLERVRDSRHRNGSTSRPATRPREPGPEREDRSAEEARWRREAQRLRERLLPLEDEVRELRERIRSRRREPGVLPYSDPKIRSWEEQAERLEERIRDRRLRFRARARRARVPPGWLR